MSCESTILGIDPGTRITGYGIIQRKGRVLVLVDYGSISPSKEKRASLRYRRIFEGVSKLVEHFSPDAVAIETQYIDKNVQSGIKLGMARGVAILAATLHEIPVFEYSPTKAKRAVVGYGRASKRQVQEMVKNLLGLKQTPQPEDAADALALALCHANLLDKEYLLCQI